MKKFKLFVTLLLFIIGVTALLSLVLPTVQTIEKTTTIQAPAKEAYAQLVQLAHFNKWAVWGQHDTSIRYTLSGKDGIINTSSTWKGDPQLSGEGKITITALEENKKVEQAIEFITPQKGKATSVFLLSEKNGRTTVTWTFSKATPRPWNIFNLMADLDKQMGKDFEEGLVALKSTVEKAAGKETFTDYNVGALNFPATTFATVRQQLKWDDISSFFAAHLPVIVTEAGKANAAPGKPAGLFYKWDEKNQQTDMAAAIPVSPGVKIDNPIIQLVDIAASKAIFVNYYGAYNKSAGAYRRLDRYLADNKLKQKFPVIEQYITDPAIEKDTSKWLTKIVFLVE